MPVPDLNHLPVNSPSPMHPLQIRMQRRARFWVVPPFLAGSALLGWLLFLALSPETWKAYSWTLELSHWPVFSDLRVVLEGIRLHEKGINPLTVGPPQYDFTYNYTTLWLSLGQIGVHQLSLPYLGFGVGVAWLTTCLGMARVRSPGLSAVLVFALLSPPVMLALERGNIDLVLSVICLFAAYAWQRIPTPWLTPALVALGAILKLYPAAALAFIVADYKHRKRLLWWILSAIVIAAYWLSHLAELELIAARTPRVTGASIGCAVLPMRYSHYLDQLFSRDFSLSTILAMSAILCAAWFGLAAWIGFKLASSFARLTVDKLEMSTFLFMSAMNAGSFALGNNFSYRLIFVLPCLPLLWRVCVTPHVSIALWQWAGVTLTAMVTVLYAPLNAIGRTFVFAQVASWILMGGLVAGCFGLYKASTTNTPSPS